MNFDLVSDLHVDVWGNDYNLNWITSKSSDTLVIAGDTSDTVEITCSYVEILQNYYKNILIVDGNHEHQTQMNFLPESILNWKDKISKTNAICLNNQDYIIDNTLFIGVNGWWSFCFGEPNITKENCLDYALKNTDLTQEMVEHQSRQSLIDASILLQKIVKAQNDSSIESIVIVTHSLPHKSCISWNRYPVECNLVGLYGNSRYIWSLDADVNKKIKYWVFGHNHDQKLIPYKHILFCSNPRGRPSDWNRRLYSIKNIKIN